MPATLARTVHEHYIRYDIVENGHVVFSIGVPVDDEMGSIEEILIGAGHTLDEYRQDDSVLISAIRQVVFFPQLMELL